MGRVRDEIERAAKVYDAEEIPPEPKERAIMPRVFVFDDGTEIPAEATLERMEVDSEGLSIGPDILGYRGTRVVRWVLRLRERW